MTRKFNICRGLLALGASAFVLSGASAQRINVFVNGDPVYFTGVGPQEINGRVLVPLRGVMEQMGAYVSWDASRNLVTATRGDVDLELRIGDRFARVNGSTVPLDVPAMIYRGSTLVPLRFMSEALGAQVQWAQATRSVTITSPVVTAEPPRPRYPDPLPPRNPAVAIQSFESDVSGYIMAGTRVTFRLNGTPGGIASFQIPGVTPEITMREVRPGAYEGEWRAPAGMDNAISVSQTSVIGKLRIGDTERVLQLANAISIDTEAPAMRAMMPAANARVVSSRPTISATFDDRAGSGIAVDNVRIWLDNREVTRLAEITSNRFTFRPDRALEPGRHDVRVTTRDRAGNITTEDWSFYVTTTGDRDIIRSFTHNAPRNPEPGTVIRFTLMAEPGGDATFSIGNRVVDIPMREISSGRYVGEYTVRRGDNFMNEVVTARFETRSGQIHTMDLDDRVGVDTPGALTAPVITSHSNDAVVRGDEIVIRGRAEPYSRVLLRVEYATSALGAIRLTGAIGEFVVDADRNGNFESRPINLDTFVRGSDTTYTINAYTLASDGTRSRVTTVRLRR